ncbi:MAG: YihY/virulence factor BrkB family protein [Hyphomicrobium sp.]|nr:YihY/virulence factor BrkB family protein [Hyphomicrobium sp.]
MVSRRPRALAGRVGALVAAVLFEAGKALSAWDIGSQGLQSTYGAAAALVVLLICVYDTAQIVPFGAELSTACQGPGKG